MLMQGFPPPPEQRVTLTRPSGSRSRSGGGAADRTPDRWGRPGAGHGGGRAPLPVRQVRSDYVCRWSDLPRRRLVKGQQGSGLGVGEVAGARPLGSHVAPCGRQRAQAVAGRRPGVEEHQAVHEATGPASCGWGYGRPSRRRCSSVLGCTEGAVTRHVEVFGFAGHSCFSASLSIFRGVEDTDRRPNTSLPRYDYAADPVAHPRVTVRMLRSTVSLKSRGVRPAGVTSVGPSASASRRPKEHHRLVRPAKPFSGTHIGLPCRFLPTAADAGARLGIQRSSFRERLGPSWRGGTDALRGRRHSSR
jgi:hypothetical protein